MHAIKYYYITKSINNNK